MFVIQQREGSDWLAVSKHHNGADAVTQLDKLREARYYSGYEFRLVYETITG